MMLSPTRLLPVIQLVAAATLVAVALLGTDLLLRGVNQPTFLLLIPIIILTAAMWGAAIGVTSAALSVAGMALLLEPRWSLSVDDSAERILLAVFGGVAIVSVLVANHYYRFREAMRVNEAEFRALFELAAVGCAMADHKTGRILRANAQFSTINQRR